MALTDNVPSNAFDVLQRNMQDADKFVNSPELTFDNRPSSNGNSKSETIAGITKKANDVIDGYRQQYIGAYALPNKTFELPGQFVVYDNDAYVYVGASALPYTTDIATYPDPNTDPNLQFSPSVTALYVQEQVKDGISNSTDIIFGSVSDMVAGTLIGGGAHVFSVNEIVQTISYYDGWAAFQNNRRVGGNVYYISSDSLTSDGGSVIDLGEGLFAVGLFLDGIDFFKFGAKGDWDWNGATGQDDGPAIQACIDFCPVKGEIKSDGNFVFGTAQQINIYKKITIDLNGGTIQALPTFVGDRVVRVAKTAQTTSESYGALQTFEGVQLKNITILGARPQYNFVDMRTDYGTIDYRTTQSSGLEVTEIDGAHFEKITIRDFKAEGLLIGSQSAIRESTFKEFNITHCGDSATQKAALTMLSPVPSAQNGIHNHIYFEHLRVINSYDSSVRFKPDTGGVAASIGSFLIHFNDGQFDNANVAGRANAHMIELYHAGYDIVFNQCAWFNPNGNAGEWGYSCVKLGVGNGATDGCEQVIFNKCRTQYGVTGNGILARNVGEVIVDGHKFAGTVEGSLIFAVVGPTTTRGTSLGEIPSFTFARASTCDYSNSSIFYHSDDSIRNLEGTYKIDGNQVTFGYSLSPDKSVSKEYTNTIASGVSNNVQIIDVSDLPDSNLYKVNSQIEILGTAIAANISGEFLALGGNTVGGVNTLSTFKNQAYAANISVTYETINNLPAGNLSAGNEDKFQIVVTNNTGETVIVNTGIFSM